MVGDTPQTYRAMIKLTLESMGGEANFEAISKYIGNRFKEQLTSKADTWKHSIAGCLSVYFARKEDKDTSGKVIWTLGAPPKPKRRGRRRDRNGNDLDQEGDLDEDERLSPSPERVTPRSSKRKKEETVSIPLEQLEALEEENECLKLLVAKKRKEDRQLSQSSSPHSVCSVCKERSELSMVVNPCGHLFCGNIFCEASQSSHCMICKMEVLTRLPIRSKDKDRNIQKNTKSLQNGVVNGISRQPNGFHDTVKKENGSPNSEYGRSFLHSLSSIVSEERVLPNPSAAPNG